MDTPDPRRHVTFIVQVKDQSRTEEVAKAIRERGLHVERVLRSVGVVGVTGPAELRSAIVGVPGVGMVREEGSFDLPPFDERVPQ